MISPANTYPCLTVSSAVAVMRRSRQVLPVGVAELRARRPADDYQGAAVAEFMKDQGVTKLYILNDKEAYGLGVATTTRKAAEFLGIEVVGFEADPKAASYESLFKKIQSSGADAVFLGGLIDENGAQVIKDKVAVLGPNDGDVKLFAPDGFTTQQTIDDAGPASAGMFMSVAASHRRVHRRREGVAESVRGGYLNGAGSTRTRSTAHRRRRSCSTRSRTRRNADDVIAKMFETQITDGLLGRSRSTRTATADASGAVVGFTIYVATDKLETAEVISPNKDVVEAAGAA